MGYSCLRHNHIWGKIVEGLWDFGMEEPFIIERLVPCSVGALKSVENNVNGRGLACDVSEGCLRVA